MWIGKHVFGQRTAGEIGEPAIPDGREMRTVGEPDSGGEICVESGWPAGLV